MELNLKSIIEHFLKDFQNLMDLLDLFLENHKIKSKSSTFKRLVNLIHDGGKQSWLSMSVDVKGDIYEGLLEKMQ